MIYRSIAAAALTLGLSSAAVAPASADGAASTRNILLGGAAAAAGTLILINHNKKVHEKYAEDARRQAEAEAQAQNAESAYAAERRAYENEVAVNGEYKHEVATQHAMIESLRKQVAQADARAHAATVAAHAPVAVPAAAAPAVAAAAKPAATPLRVARTSWGWGTF